MTEVTFLLNDGQTQTVTVRPGESLMHCARRHLVPGIIGECGGSMACATCHAYIDAASFDRLPAPTSYEMEMLQGCLDTRPNSRLTCQITLDGSLPELTVEVPQLQI